MRWVVVETPEALAERAAERVLADLEARPTLVLGLPTGRTPLGVYRRLVEACRDRSCFARAQTFNLDEYVGLAPSHAASYCQYMQRNLFDHVDLPEEGRHLPDGTAAAVRRLHPEVGRERALRLECVRYEAALAAAGGLGLTLLGLGHNGHIAFNEPGSPFDSRTRLVELADSTREANADEFGSPEAVPRRGITLGIGTLLESRSILLLAQGEGKAEAVARLASEQVDEDFPASALLRHPDVTVIVDRAAGAATTTPP